MCTVASAAILLAALTALPTHGTGTNNATQMPSMEKNLATEHLRPTVNILYQILYATYTDLNYQNNSSHYNFLDNPVSVNYKINYNNVEYVTNNKYLSDIHKNDVSTAETYLQIFELTDSGANVNISDIRQHVRRRGRRKRVVNVNRSLDDISNSTKRTKDLSTIIIPTSTYASSDRRRKPGESGSSSPLLNYIFDAYSSAHQHRNDRTGNSNSIYAAAAPEIEALVGSTAHLDCKVDALHDKVVSWVRRKNDDVQMDLLTTGTQLYTTDDRYSSKFIPPDIWRLEVRDVRPSDDAHYDCQLSAHPPRTARVTLHVPEVSVRIIDGAGAEVAEQVCEKGSTVALRCEVRGLRMEGGPALLWYRRESLLNDDTTRGGISVRTEFGMNGANSVLRVARVRLDDAGRYTCSIAKSPPVSLPPAHVMLHVINGGSLAELHQGGCSTASPVGPLVITALAMCIYVYK